MFIRTLSIHYSVFVLFWVCVFFLCFFTVVVVVVKFQKKKELFNPEPMNLEKIHNSHIICGDEKGVTNENNTKITKSQVTIVYIIL